MADDFSSENLRFGFGMGDKISLDSDFPDHGIIFGASVADRLTNFLPDHRELSPLRGAIAPLPRVHPPRSDCRLVQGPAVATTH